MPKMKPTIYVETTIPNFFFDFKNQSSEKNVSTVFFWENSLKDFRPVTSLATIRELEATPNRKWKSLLLKFIENIEIIEINEKIIGLANQYIQSKLISKNYSADAIHLALNTIHKIDYLLTWNIQHLAHPTRRKLLRDYNISKNLYVTEIVTPRELNYKIN